MSAPRVSLIVCAYNAEQTIAECLNSLVEQTRRDFEVVVIDDGSTDGTVAAVERQVAGSPVTIRVVGMPHQGLAGARNAGVSVGVGDFIAFVDADDLVEPTMVERMLACADATGADLVVCDMQYVDFETGSLMHVLHEGDLSLYGAALVDRPGLLGHLGASACNKFMHRSLFERSGITFPVGSIFEDLWTVYRLCGEARLIAKVDEPLYRYRVGRQGSIVSAYDDRYLQIADALVVTNDYFIDKGDFGVLRSDLLTQNFNHLIFGRYTNLLVFGSRAVRYRYLSRVFAHMDRYFPGWRREKAVREMTGRFAKHVVFTHRPLLALYSDFRARFGWSTRRESN